MRDPSHSLTHLSLTHILSHSLTHSHFDHNVPTHQFTAGEPKLGYKKSQWNNPRCSSIFTAKVNGESLYGYVDRFIKVTCQFSVKYINFALVKWFAKPTYPDNDPLTTDIDLRGDAASDVDIIDMNDIDPSRILFLVNSERTCMNVMRIEGVNVSVMLPSM